MAACVTTEHCKSWEKSGKQEFVKLCKKKLTNGDDVLLGDVKRAIYEVCWHAVRGKIKTESLFATLADVTELHPDVTSLLADTLGILDAETICGAENSESEEDKTCRDQFLAFIPHCMTVLPEALLKERLDPETLETIGILQTKQGFLAKYVKTKTRLYYKQQKFNLLREESEGYSKLITELLQDFSNVSYLKIVDNIRSLIGCFNLDPNRVLDVILESFECRPDQDDFFVPLLQAYTTDRVTICHILGFKYHFYQQTDDCETPKSLYQVTALLLHHRLIDLDTLYPHLNISDSDILERYKREVLEAKNYARKLSVVILSEKAKEDKEKEDKDDKLLQAVDNQKVSLVEALLKVTNWEHAKTLMDKLPPFYVVSHQPVAEAVCSLIHSLIDPLYIQYSGLPPLLLKRKQELGLGDKKGLKTVQSFQDLRDMVFPMLRYLGPHLHCDTNLLVKLLRLAKAFVTLKNKVDDPMELAKNEEIFRCFLTATDECILPSLSLLPANCCLSEEVWAFLKMLKYEYRYRLYGQWKNEVYKEHPKLIRCRADIIDKSKYVMKRLAKENVKPLGRQIGKLSHSNPGVLFEYILNQIQKHDNFIGPVVDSLKFLTSLSYDMLAYCIIEALANPEREKMKHDDTNISLWLQSLASFSGAVFKKYQIELGGLLQYVTNQLKAGKSYDLLILREVIQKMAGIEVSEEITDDQLAAMSGGDLLKQEGGQYSQVRNTKKSSNRLKDTLLEHELAIPLCLLMAQQRSAIVFTPTSGQLDGDKRHLKLIGKLYDQCQDTFVQFSSFLSSSLSIDEVSKRLPKLDELLTQYFLSPDAVFALCRPLYANQIEKKFEEFRKADRKDKEKQTTAAKNQRYIEAGNSVLTPAVALLQPLELVRNWEDLTPQFYATFWSLTMTDLMVPSSSYEKQVTQFKQQLIAIEENHDLAPSKKKKEKERCISLIDKIQEEERKQQDHVSRVMARLKADKDTWFIAKSQKHATVTSLLQMCLFPRCCFTAIDAIYSAKFLHVLHNLKTPHFSSLICYDRILADITWAMTSCTENEGHRYGRFLSAIFDDIMRWHADKAIFEKECSNFPGFKTVFRNAGKETSSNVADQLDYENYRHLCYKWHYHMTKVFVACMDSGEFLQTRNAVIVLTKVLTHYPRISKFVTALEKRVDKVCQEQKEKRPDLYALAMGYAGQMKLRKKTWVNESEFHQVRRPDTAKVENKVMSIKKEPGTASKTDTDSSKNQSGREASDRDKSEKEPEKREYKTSVKVEKDIKEKKDKENDSHDRSSSRDKDSSSSNKSKEKKDKKEKKESRKEREDKVKVKEERGRGDEERRGKRDEKDRLKEEKRSAGDGKGSSSDAEKSRERSSTKDGERSRLSGGGEMTRREKDRRDKDGGMMGSEHAAVAALKKSPEPSPKRLDERESKRRKLDANSSKSPPPEQVERDKSRDRLAADKTERKRERSLEDSPADYKRHKSDEISGKSKQNGDSNIHQKKVRSRSSDRDRERLKEREMISDVHINSNKKSPRSWRESPEKQDRERDRKVEKSSTKKSKHH